MAVGRAQYYTGQARGLRLSRKERAYGQPVGVTGSSWTGSSVGSWPRLERRRSRCGPTPEAAGEVHESGEGNRQREVTRRGSTPHVHESWQRRDATREDERDLHEGAQQQLVARARLARSSGKRSDEREQHSEELTALRQASRSARDLREIAIGGSIGRLRRGGVPGTHAPRARSPLRVTSDLSRDGPAFRSRWRWLPNVVSEADETRPYADTASWTSR